MFAQFLRARSRLNPVICASAVNPYTRTLQRCLYARFVWTTNESEIPQRPGTLKVWWLHYCSCRAGLKRLGDRKVV